MFCGLQNFTLTWVWVDNDCQLTSACWHALDDNANMVMFNVYHVHHISLAWYRFLICTECSRGWWQSLVLWVFWLWTSWSNSKLIKILTSMEKPLQIIPRGTYNAQFRASGNPSIWHLLRCFSLNQSAELTNWQINGHCHTKAMPLARLRIEYRGLL